MASEFMLRQRKLLEDIKENNGTPPLKSIYGPVTQTNNTHRTLQNITGPGGQEFFDATNDVKDAYNTGGFSSAAGVAVRNIPGVVAATVRDTITPEPLRRGLSSLIGEAKEFGTAVASGKATPTPIAQINQTNPLDTNTLATNEKQNALRDSTLGALSANAEALPDGSQKNTYSIGNNNLSYNLSENDLAIKKSLEDIDNYLAQGNVPTPEQQKRIDALRRQAGFMRGGTDRGFNTDSRQGANTGPRRRLGNLDVEFDSSVDAASRERFLENPVRPTAQIDRYNANRGSEGNTLAASSRAARNIVGRRAESPKVGWKERVADKKNETNLRIQGLAKQQSQDNLESTLNSNQTIAQYKNETDQERNQLMQDRNLIAANKKTALKPLVIDDGLGGQKIMVPGPDGNYVDGTVGQTETPTKATIAKMKSLKGDKHAEDIYRKRFGQLPY